MAGKLLTAIRRFLEDIYGPTKPMTDRERYEYLGKPKKCIKCGLHLRARTVQGVVTVFCPSREEEHSIFVFYPEEVV